MVRERPQAPRRVRIVSLLPSATEIAVALGLGEHLVGRSHECDWPPEVAALPALSSSKIKPGMRSAEIDRTCAQIVRDGLSVYSVDADKLRALKPDVILTQTQCAVCAVTPRDLEQALADWTGEAPTLVSLAPDTLSDVWDDHRRVGAATGRDAEAVVRGLQEQLAALSASLTGERPTVAAIEWIDPLMAAGNWIPELIEIAGGQPLLAAAGQHSPFIGFDDLAAADPDVIVLMPCGFRIGQSLSEIDALTGQPGWAELSAVRSGRVFVADGHHYFNRPGPRLVESAEILAECLGTRPTNDHRGRGWVWATPVVVASKAK